MTRESFSSAFKLWLPHHWPAWFAVGLLRLLAPLPLEALFAIGRFVGVLAFYVVPVRRAVTLRNLELCFPALDAKSRWRLARDCYASFGIGIFEVVFSYFANPKRFEGRYTLRGWEHVEAAQANQTGIILLSVHSHTMEIGGSIAIRHCPLSAFYRNPNNPVFTYVRKREHVGRLAHRFAVDDIKSAVRALRQGAILWYAPDQGKRFKQTVIAPFFGVPAVTNAATHNIAQLGRAVILPWFTLRTKQNGKWHYLVTVKPPLQHAPEDTVEKATLINQLVEGMVRQAPEQYLWQHKRFKGRGDAYPDVYEGMK